MDVLDVACGEGYGSMMLAKAARSVVGVDIDEQVILRARKNYRRNRNVSFEVANCVTLPFPDQSFDVIVSMETVEHLTETEQEKFVTEVRRVARRNVLFIISTPNREVYSEQSGKENPFHKRELREQEFRQLLRRSFKAVEVWGQRFYIHSIIAPLAANRTKAARSGGAQRPPATPASSLGSYIDGIAHPQYFVAFCSDKSVQSLDRRPSLFIDQKDDLWREQETILRWASGLHEEDEALRTRLREREKRLAELQSIMEGQKADHDALVTKVKELEGIDNRLAGQAALLNNQIKDLKDGLTAARSQNARIESLRKRESRALFELRANSDRASQREQELLKELESLRIELQSARQMLDTYSHALLAARTEVQGLEGQLKISQQGHALASANVEKMSAEIVALRELNAAASRDAERRLNVLKDELATEKRNLQAAVREVAESSRRVRDVEGKLHVGEQMRQRLDEQILRGRDKIESDRKLNEQLRQQLVVVLSERAALTQRAETLEAETKLSVEHLQNSDRALNDRDEALALCNAQFSFLRLKESVVRDMAVAAKTVRPKIGQMPLGLTFENARLRPSLRPRTEARRKRHADWKAVASSGLFDGEWYLGRNADVATAGVAALAHFMTYGITEDRDPHPLFSSGWYRIQMHRHGAPTDLPPLLHYLSAGRAQRLSPHALFDPTYYLATYRDVAESGVDPLEHFLMCGAAELRNPHPLVWMERLAKQPGFAAGSRTVLVDYLSNPRLFAASPHPLFDAAAYLQENPDVGRAEVNPLLHYCAVGWRQGRAAHRLFAGDWYLARNPDVLAADIDPLAHFVRHGAQEYRAPHPLFDIKFYYARYRNARRLPYDALSDYVMNGLGSEPRETTPRISVADVRALVPPDALENAAPIVAFIDSDFMVANRTAGLEVSGGRQVAAWPPVPSPTYWLRQRLRDYIIQRFGEEVIGLYVYLMAIVERHGERQNDFPQTRDFAILCDRLRVLAAKHHAEGEVDVSIVVPVFNHLLYTLTSLVSLLEHDSRRSYEILVGDDGSTDETPKVFAAAGGCIRLIRHEQNLGFLGNCNRTASFAKGRNIAFLNNDTLLLPGWLDALVDALEKTPDAGLAGSKLLNADGTLQEAGGILWRDGSAWNFGRNDDPGLPAYNYLKDVDYVSGASLALPATLWRQLGGFDVEFAPAYCEDSDLAFRVRQTGLRTLYAPHSMLIHHEGQSHGRDTGTGIKAFQVENQKKLFSRWKHVLEDNQPNGQSVFVARDRSSRKPHILFVDHYIPQWDRDAGSRTMFHFLRMFVAEGFQVSLWPDNLHEDRPYCAPLQRLGIEVIYGPSYVGGFEKFIAEAGPYLDYALVSRPEVAIKYYDAIRIHTKARILYYGHDVHWKRMEQARALASAAEEPDAAEDVERMRELEAENWRKTDVALYPSSEERDLVRSLVPETTAAQVPMLGYVPEEFSVAWQNVARFDQRSADELLFVGGSHPPNIDALVWFAREVMPRVLAGNPRARLNIVGATMAAAVERLDSDTIRVLGRISDDELASLYASMGVALVPLRYGAGVKGKTIEAFANAIPLVTTSVGLQGITSDQPLAFVADDVQGVAEAVLRAQTDTATAKAQAEAGVRFMERTYSMRALRDAFAPFVHELASARADRTELATAAQGA
jgi:GT2 family glycosyltransferase/SAM-dependent methyltransferase/glycosyltransferase involved in cell wall biosynthesis